MKIRKYNLSQALITLFLFIILQNVLHAQNDYNVIHNYHGYFFSVNLEPSQTHIINERNSSVQGLVSNKIYTGGGSLEIGKFLGESFGVSTGMGFNLYQTQIKVDAFQSNNKTLDSENEEFELRVSATDVKEDQKIGCISVPLNMHLHIPLGDNGGIMVQLGASLNVPVIKEYKTNGTFTYKGFYPKYTVLLENLPDFGFPDNLNTFKSGNFELAPIFFSSKVSAGFYFNLVNNTQLGFAIEYSKTFTNISAYKYNDNFQLSTGPNIVSSFMSESNSTSAEYIGITFSFRYFFGSNN